MSYLSLNAFEASNQIEINIFRLHLDKVLPQAFIWLSYSVQQAKLRKFQLNTSLVWKHKLGTAAVRRKRLLSQGKAKKFLVSMISSIPPVNKASWLEMPPHFE